MCNVLPKGHKVVGLPKRAPSLLFGHLRAQPCQTCSTDCVPCVACPCPLWLATDQPPRKLGRMVKMDPFCCPFKGSLPRAATGTQG